MGIDLCVIQWECSKLTTKALEIAQQRRSGVFC